MAVKSDTLLQMSKNCHQPCENIMLILTTEAERIFRNAEILSIMYGDVFSNGKSDYRKKIKTGK